MVSGLQTVSGLELGVDGFVFFSPWVWGVGDLGSGI